jgi:hypothetical protein
VAVDRLSTAAAKAVYRRGNGYSMNDELERTGKDEVVVYLELLAPISTLMD